MLWLLLSACAASPAVPASKPAVPVASSETYGAVCERLGERRAALASTYGAVSESGRSKVLEQSRSLVLDAITEDLIPRWTGTPWSFYGTSQIPGEGEIACGYFVSTILRDAGFEVERVRLAQQAAEHIERTFLPASALKRFRDPARGAVNRVVDHVAADGEALWLVGLDSHVGFLWNDGAAVRMCHASYLGSGVICEDARSSPAMPSKYTVIGKLLDDAMIDGWLRGRAFPTVTH